MIPVAFVIVLGNHALGVPALVDPKTMFVTFSSKVFGASPRRRPLTGSSG